jgi:SOS-response transcriptional repressor LexA
MEHSHQEEKQEQKEKLQDFYHDNKRMPTYSELAKLWGFKSKNAVFRLVEKMVAAGVVAKDHLGRLVPTEFFNQTPMLGLVKAGLPSAIEGVATASVDESDMMSFDDFLIQDKTKTYILEVDGDSMIEAHIAEGDLVVVERASTAREGDIVIAEVDGDWTMKYFHEKGGHGGRPWLEPANKNYAPIHPEHSFHVAAIVRGVVRKY